VGTIYGTSGNDYLLGSEEDDTISDDEGNDTLIGGSGDDRLVGGGGNDTLTGGEGKDTFVLYYSGGGIDTITDFSVKQDYISVENTFHKSVSGNLNRSPQIENFINSIKSKSSSLTFESSQVVPLQDGIFTYYKSTGALFYYEQQLAWLPPNLDWPKKTIKQHIFPDNASQNTMYDKELLSFGTDTIPLV
jgi:Ca2+-binding RTX toxin-like protein